MTHREMLKRKVSLPARISHLQGAQYKLHFEISYKGVCLFVLTRRTKVFGETVFGRLNQLVILSLRYENRSVNAAAAATRVPIVGQS